MIRLTNL